MPATDFADVFLARHPRFAGFVDSDEANAQAALLRANGLDAINAKVLQSPLTEVLDVIAEHNVGAMLVRRGLTALQHEPPSMAKPIDFVGARDGRGYRVEVKRLAASEHDALCATVMKTLNAALKSDTQPIVIDMYLDEAFEAADINELVRHVKRALHEPCTGKAYEFACEGEVVASYKFRPSANATYPYVGVLGDFAGELRNVTGVEASRVLRKVRRAYDKFKACPDDGAVHLVALAVDNTVHLADVAEALYGREHVTFTRQGHASSGRGPGGAFHRGPDGHSRLDGLVVARRLVSSRLFCAYVFTLFVNPAGTLPVADVAEALGVDRVLGPDEFP